MEVNTGAEADARELRQTNVILSDREPSTRYNIWAFDADRGTLRQVTHSPDDITFPAIGPSEIVFQAGGRLYLFDLATEQSKEVRVQVTSDLASHVTGQVLSVSGGYTMVG